MQDSQHEHGGPGDHWYSDVFTFGLLVFGEPSDSLIRDIRRFGGDRLLKDDAPLGRRLWGLWPSGGRFNEEGLRRLAADLVPIRDELRADAKASGWEIE